MRLPAIFALLTCVSLASGVTPQTWTHDTEADFAKGKFEGTAPNSLGEIRLSREVKLLLPSASAPAVVSAVALGGKTLYLASGSEPAVYRLAGSKSELLAKLPGAMVPCLLWTGEDLLAGTSGEGAGVYRVTTAGKVEKLWAGEGVQYVWAIVRGPGGQLYAATGCQGEGKVFALDAGGQATAIYQAGKLARNILCLALGSDGTLYAGTDEKGLVVAIDPREKTSRVILDAEEKEISSLYVDERGGVFAATSDASKAAPAGTGKGVQMKGAKTGPEMPTSMPSAQTKPQPSGEGSSPSSPNEPAAQPPASQPGETPDAGNKASEQPSAGTASPAFEPAGPSKASAASPSAGLSAPAKTQADALPKEPARRGNEAAGEPARKPNASSPKEPAAEDGEPQPASAPAAPTPSPSPAAKSMPSPRPSAAGGNAVYYIRPDGLVETRFRRPVTILAMLMQEEAGGKVLLLGTGNGGAIYSLAASGEQYAQLADTESSQVTCFAPGEDGEVYFGTANKGSVGLMGRGLAPKGTYTSEVLDAAQRAQWGTLSVRADVPPGAAVAIATRSGNVQEADDGTWGSWSKSQPPDGLTPIGSPAGRFLQYRLELSGSSSKEPVVREVQIVYQVGNLPPVLAAVAVQPSDKYAARNLSTGGPQAFRVMDIRASDPNGDKLNYTIEFRLLDGQTWVKIAKDLDQPKFTWDTRTVADGAYELRVTASDSPSNPPSTALEASRTTAAVIVDNTPPTVTDLSVKPTDEGLLISGQAVDALSRITAIAYSVDSQEEWTAIAPVDGMCDSLSESFRFVAKDKDDKDLPPGPHRISVKVTDSCENVGYASLSVTK